MEAEKIHCECGWHHSRDKAKGKLSVSTGHNVSRHVPLLSMSPNSESKYSLPSKIAFAAVLEKPLIQTVSPVGGAMPGSYYQKKGINIF